MVNFSHIKRMCICAICIALCCVMPLAFHAFDLGSIFSPMHFPVLLCGLVCGGWYGLACGLIGPLLSHLVTGMPYAAALPSMVSELAIYGLVCGLLMHFIRTKNTYADIYCAMVPAMLLGRIAGGVAQVFVFMGNAKTYSMTLWVSSYFVKAVPAIVSQLIVLPALVLLLMKARLIPARYPKQGV